MQLTGETVAYKGNSQERQQCTKAGETIVYEGRGDNSVQRQLKGDTKYKGNSQVTQTTE